jgi:hypothetical protein
VEFGLGYPNPKKSQPQIEKSPKPQKSKKFENGFWDSWVFSKKIS